MMKGSAQLSKRTLAANATCNWLGFGASVVIALVMSPILIHGLGDQRYGIWSLVEALVFYLTLLDLGIGASVVRYVAKFEAVEDKEQLDRVFSTTLCIFLAAGLLALGVSAGAALLWLRPFGVPVELAADTRWLLVLLGANVAVRLSLGVFTSVLYALGRFPAKTAIETGIRLATAGLMLVVLYRGGGLVALATLILASTLVKGLCDAVAVRFYLPNLRFSPTLAGMETFRSIRGYSLRAFVLMIAGRISYSSDAIVIGAFLAPEYITYFVVAARLIEYVKTGTCSITNVLTPAISALEARGDYATIRRAFCDGTRYILWLIVPVVVGLLMLGKAFLTLWLGAPYADRSYPTLAILSIPLLFYLSQSIGGRILYGIGKLRWFSRFAAAQAVANLSLSIALIGPLGIEGVAIGTAIPSLLMAVVMAAYACRTLQVTTSEYLRRAYFQPLVLAILPIAVWAAPLPSPSASWANLVITGTIGLLSYWAAAALLEFGPAPILRFLKSSRPTASR